MKSLHGSHFDTVDVVSSRLSDVDYIANRQIATAIYLALQPGEADPGRRPGRRRQDRAGQGHRRLLGLPLIRLQCYEGLDEAKALYEWKYGKQLLYTQMLKDKLGELLDGANGLAASMERLHEYRRPVLLRALPGAAPAAEGAAAGARLRPADRRDRQVRRRVRGLPAGDAVGLPGLDPRARHDQGQDHADGVPHLATTPARWATR